MYNLLQISTCVGLMVRFFFTGQYMITMQINRYMSAELWVLPGTVERVAEVWAAKRASETCTSPSQFDFEWSSDFLYTSHACLPPCGVSAPGTRCVHGGETLRREAEDQVLFITQLEDRVTRADGRTERALSFVPLEEAH